MISQTIYLRLRQKFSVDPDEQITIGKLAQIVAPEEIKATIQKLEVHRVRPEDQSHIVIDVMKVIDKISSLYPDTDIQTIGPSQTILEVKTKKQRIRPILFLMVWIVLFIGSGLAIMNFHEDVAMESAHQKLYYMITGNRMDKPLILQIPYSIGLGIGMVLFFNHIFKKRFNEEPSPLEVEMFNYQQDLDQYVIIHENKKSEEKLK